MTNQKHKSLEKPTNKNTRESLIEKGLQNLFNRYYNSDNNTEAMRKYILSYPEVLSDRYDSISSDEHLNEIFKAAGEFEIDLYAIPFWKEKIQIITKEATEDAHSIWQGKSDYVLSAANMIPDFDWKPLFDSVSAKQNYNNYLRFAYTTIAKNFANASPSAFKDHVDESIFFSKERKPAYFVRGLMYSLYTKHGFLTKKTARKMRSDASSDSSLSGVRALAENLSLYANQDELLLQFTDSKYEGVVCYLADNLPEHLITSIMGTEFYWAKRRIEERLEKIEREKEQPVMTEEEQYRQC